MKIAICDNDLLHLESIKDRVSAYFEGSADISVFTDDILLVENIKSGFSPDILIMDIELDDGRNGIDAVKTVNTLLPQCKTIFLTGYIEYVSSVYETEHEYYVLKTNIDKDLPKALKKVTSSVFAEKKTIFIENKSGSILIDTSEIYYIERDKRTSKIVCDNTAYCTSKKLDELLKDLDGNCFVRCHNSFVVNLKKVATYKKAELYLANGETLKVSRTYKKSVDEAFLHYVKSTVNI